MGKLTAILALAIFVQLLNWTLQTKNGYMINSRSCRIPNYNPFDESIRHFYRRYRPISCDSEVPPLTSISSSVMSNTLHLHHDRFKFYTAKFNTSANYNDQIVCCYRLITRGFTDKRDGFKLERCQLFNKSVTFTGAEEFLEVACTRLEDMFSRIVYNNFHAFIGLNKNSNRKMKKTTKFDTGSRHTKMEDLSVMIIGFDSMSRLNMMRTMPKTVNYLAKTGWYTFKGYNKIADNTFPNLAAMLTGMSERQLVNSCWPTPKTPFDNCPVIWKNFSDKGYITAYAEDQPGSSSFNNEKLGFRDQPTDYYLRPFMLAVDYNIYNVKNRGYGNFFVQAACQMDLVFNYSINFASTFRKYRTFSLFWSNSFSHSDLNMPTAYDDNTVANLKRLQDTGIFNSTMILLLSGHGQRAGPTLQTYIGYLEERLPIMNIWLPEWFRRAFPTQTWNLEVNGNSLTSPFDVYMTLVDILGKKQVAKGCPKCRGLFHRVSWDRSCADAGISEHWCSCGDFVGIQANSSLGTKLAVILVTKLNAVVARYKSYVVDKSCYCALLKVKKVLFIRKRLCKLTSCDEKFVIGVQTTPMDAKFMGTLSFSKAGYWTLLDGISRIDSHGDDSKCISHYSAKEYCVCVQDRLTKNNKNNPKERIQTRCGSK